MVRFLTAGESHGRALIVILDLEDLGERMAARKKDLIGKIAAEGLPAPKTRTVTGPALEKDAPLSEAPQA